MFCPWPKATASKEKDEEPRPAFPAPMLLLPQMGKKVFLTFIFFTYMGKGSAFLERVQLNAQCQALTRGCDYL